MQNIPESRAPTVDRRWRWMTIALLAWINGIVLLNALLHDPRAAYDAGDHVTYFKVLGVEGRLPTPADTKSFFHPPVPYLFPAAIRRIAAGLVEPRLATGVAAKAGQLQNVFLSILLTFFLLRLCAEARPGNARFAAVTLLGLAILPVYYKSFAMLRGEPWLASLAVVATSLAARGLLDGRFAPWRVAALGSALGVALLSRVFGVLSLAGLLLASLVLRLGRPARYDARALVPVVVSVVAGLGAGGWFYVRSSLVHGSEMPYRTEINVAGARGAENLAADTADTADLRHLFTEPVRPFLSGHALAILYSEVWGDYFSYFTYSARDPSLPMRRYLGRVNLVSVLASFVYASGLLVGVAAALRFARGRGAERDIVVVLCAAYAVCSVAGYLWYIVAVHAPAPGDRYPWENEDKLKATYLLQVFPFIALLAADALERVRRRSRRLYAAAVLTLVLVGVHDAGAMVTRRWLTSSREVASPGVDEPKRR